jgi:hypothetical protein
MSKAPDNASGAGMETKACLIEGGTYFADRLVGPDRTSADHACMKREDKSYVTELVSRTDASRLLAEKDAELQRLRDDREQLRQIAQAWADAFEGKRKANEAGQPGFEFNDSMYETLGRALVVLSTLNP